MKPWFAIHNISGATNQRTAVDITNDRPSLPACTSPTDHTLWVFLRFTGFPRRVQTQFSAGLQNSPRVMMFQHGAPPPRQRLRDAFAAGCLRRHPLRSSSSYRWRPPLSGSFWHTSPRLWLLGLIYWLCLPGVRGFQELGHFSGPRG